MIYWTHTCWSLTRLVISPDWEDCPLCYPVLLMQMTFIFPVLLQIHRERLESVHIKLSPHQLNLVWTPKPQNPAFWHLLLYNMFVFDLMHLLWRFSLVQELCSIWSWPLQQLSNVIETPAQTVILIQSLTTIWHALWTFLVLWVQSTTSACSTPSQILYKL